MRLRSMRPRSQQSHAPEMFEHLLTHRRHVSQGSPRWVGMRARTTRLSKMESRSFVCCRRNLLGCRKINAVRSVLVKLVRDKKLTNF
jgi:hypothetical protein